MGRQSLSASSPFRTRYVAGKRQADVRVATAFRLRALFGHELPRFDITADGTSPEPFGFEPFSDHGKRFTGRNSHEGSPQPFGFEPFSDLSGGDTSVFRLEVATAFRLRALFGLTKSNGGVGANHLGRQSLSASSPFRTGGNR